MAPVHQAVPGRGRDRLPGGDPVNGITRAEVCVAACAEAWRGDGAILASPMGLIPSLGARLARLTFSPDLLLTDGEAYLVDAAGGIEGWLPYAKVFTMLAAGRRHVMRLRSVHPGSRSPTWWRPPASRWRSRTRCRRPGRRPARSSA